MPGTPWNLRKGRRCSARSCGSRTSRRSVHTETFVNMSFALVISQSDDNEHGVDWVCMQAFQLQQEKANQKLMKKDRKRIAQMVAAGMPIVGSD